MRFFNPSPSPSHPFPPQTIKAHPLLSVCGGSLSHTVPLTDECHIFPQVMTQAPCKAPTLCWRKQTAYLNMSSIPPLPGITVTNWPLWQHFQLRVDRLTDRKHKSAAHTNLGRQGMGNRCARPLWHRQLLLLQHFNQLHVQPALVSLKNSRAPEAQHQCNIPGVTPREPTKVLGCSRERGDRVHQ